MESRHQLTRQTTNEEEHENVNWGIELNPTTDDEFQYERKQITDEPERADERGIEYI